MIRKLLRLFALPFAFFVVAIVRAIRPWVLVRFGDTYSSRLGHLMANTECYLGERDAGLHPRNSYDIWMHRDMLCNKVVARKYAKCLHVWPNWFGSLVVSINQLWAGAEKHTVLAQQLDRDIHNLYERFSPHIDFSAREIRRGERLLRALGVPRGAQYVCLIVRDAAYLTTTFGDHNFSYHDYRDSDIGTYLWAAVALAKRGYYVLRMGRIVAKPFLVKHTHIIDYATSDKRSDFADLYLGATCAFCLGSPTGFTAIPAAFRRPLVMVNHAPLDYLSTFYANSLGIWKHHVKDGKRMRLAEIYASGAAAFEWGFRYQQAGITLQDNSPREILDAAMEMADRLTGVCIYSDEDEIRQHRFWQEEFQSEVLSPYNQRRLHGKVRMRIGREFLKAYYADAPCLPTE